jgi:hypothetical protein
MRGSCCERLWVVTGLGFISLLGREEGSIRQGRRLLGVGCRAISQVVCRVRADL